MAGDRPATSIGVEDPYRIAGRCDRVTDDGRCRFAIERPQADPSFAAERRRDEYACPVADPDAEWENRDCPHYRCTSSGRRCRRCGLEERRDAMSDERPLIEEHHLVYPDGSSDHEITVDLCRWCHAKVHDSWARISDDVAPAPEALAAREARTSAELEELEFSTAADRLEDG